MNENYLSIDHIQSKGSSIDYYYLKGYIYISDKYLLSTCVLHVDMSPLK